ncbi:hypothetical protein F4561_002683 [Lipingzhangella halophila]|uniref:Uncharacterized protein n=1 Tax=Lipingzhangella halophila TaxID=1783352 RepID=A0A7W7RH30_9ACTN|nr:hypothetical protein [Lipingzhangella halophila]MBB4931863.1 hypothetical protein [Lipingzhangella halophila]
MTFTVLVEDAGFEDFGGIAHRHFTEDFDAAAANAVFASASNDQVADIYRAGAPLRRGIPRRAPFAQTCCCPADPDWHLRGQGCGHPTTT